MFSKQVVLKEKVSIGSTGTQTSPALQTAVGASSGAPTSPAPHTAAGASGGAPTSPALQTAVGASGGAMSGSMVSPTRSEEAVKKSATSELETSLQTTEGNQCSSAQRWGVL